MAAAKRSAKERPAAKRNARKPKPIINPMILTAIVTVKNRNRKGTVIDERMGKAPFRIA